MKSKFYLHILIAAFVCLLSACEQSNAKLQPKSVELLPVVNPEERVELIKLATFNEEAPVPPMCYTKTQGDNNPCYVCHQMYDKKQPGYRVNKLNDGSVQGTYLFSDIGVNNQWKNLFVDRSEWVNQISDKAIQTYVEKENYSQLVEKLKNSDWTGFIPDLKDYQQAEKAFDDKGIAKDGSGWVAFNYKPMPSTFWPTNGSTDDVLIRLPKAYRTLNGAVNHDVYLANLSLVELNIKQLESIAIFPLNEKQLAADVDGDNELSTSSNYLVKRSHYLGDANNIALALQQFPQGTEFMHSVRYLGVNSDDEIHVPARMKELRYMRKTKVLSESQLVSRFDRERKEKLLGELPSFVNFHDKGISNGMGWLLQGYIEDYEGELRLQTLEEHKGCMGCHSAIGTSIDQTFSFARKVSGPKGWGYVNLKGMQDAASVTQEEGEILQYLKMSGGGNEFRENEEMQTRWFTADGKVDEAKVKQADVYELITPSKERALKLNKAYTHIVRHQSFIHGRDATIKPVTNVLKQVDESVSPLKSEKRLFGWDIRLKH